MAAIERKIEGRHVHHGVLSFRETIEDGRIRGVGLDKTKQRASDERDDCMFQKMETAEVTVTVVGPEIAITYQLRSPGAEVAERDTVLQCLVATMVQDRSLLIIKDFSSLGILRQLLKALSQKANLSLLPLARHTGRPQATRRRARQCKSVADLAIT